ncbi:nitroreductase [Xenorhabdus thuongxuanensis]|uniref:Nitroreductase n=1 Tax=Xenorhabdus thuongxuanensis TaxID=1873484 RepID=A0A1Q5U9E4_9GAMM|nr:nitroreductase [Xenorhabdus thuongxuanensis]OKP09098.1 nitroreductase [Xenorhabdus thuongxuanensis]
MSTRTLAFDEAVRNRFSSRAFLPTPLTEEQIRQVLTDAQHSPSNCNTQPWHVHIASGKTKDTLEQAMIRNDQTDLVTPDFTFNYADFYGDYFDRSQEQARIYYEALGVSREDKAKRHEVYLRNFRFFGAPHVAFLFMPSFGDNVRVASDIGMYAQTFLLSLTARGYAGIPQTLLGFHADTVRKILNVSGQYRLLFGISFGYADPNALTHHVRMERIPVDESVILHN